MALNLEDKKALVAEVAEVAARRNRWLLRNIVASRSRR